MKTRLSKDGEGLIDDYLFDESNIGFDGDDKTVGELDRIVDGLKTGEGCYIEG